MITKRFLGSYFLLHKFHILFDDVVVLSVLIFTLITADHLIAVKWPFFI